MNFQPVNAIVDDRDDTDQPTDTTMTTEVTSGKFVHHATALQSLLAKRIKQVASDLGTLMDITSPTHAMESDQESNSPDQDQTTPLPRHGEATIKLSQVVSQTLVNANLDTEQGMKSLMVGRLFVKAMDGLFEDIVNNIHMKKPEHHVGYVRNGDQNAPVSSLDALIMLTKSGMLKGKTNHRRIPDADFARKLHTQLQKCKIGSNPVHVFLDKECLKEGKHYVGDFLKGLQSAKVIVIILTKEAMSGITKADESQDNMLLEIEHALERLEEPDSNVKVFYLVPSSDTNAFDSDIFPDKPHCHKLSPRKSTTVRETRPELFSLQAFVIDKDKVVAIADRLVALARGKGELVIEVILYDALTAAIFTTNTTAWSMMSTDRSNVRLKSAETASKQYVKYVEEMCKLDNVSTSVKSEEATLDCISRPLEIVSANLKNRESKPSLESTMKPSSEGLASTTLNVDPAVRNEVKGTV
ncbi:hypothetical protein HDU76_003867 [Blyttiomyces sp. JEL0837]|nr:hypothetical protein HDU76_003867 [Blyttiomyces sp. JEL0837]